MGKTKCIKCKIKHDTQNCEMRDSLNTYYVTPFFFSLDFVFFFFENHRWFNFARYLKLIRMIRGCSQMMSLFLGVSPLSPLSWSIIFYLTAKAKAKVPPFSRHRDVWGLQVDWKSNFWPLKVQDLTYKS